MNVIIPLLLSLAGTLALMGFAFGVTWLLGKTGEWDLCAQRHPAAGP